MNEKLSVPFRGYVDDVNAPPLAKLFNGEVLFARHAEVAPQPEGFNLSITLFDPDDSTQPSHRWVLTPHAAKHLADALNRVAFGIDPEPFAIGISGGYPSSVSCSRGHWSWKEFEEARQQLEATAAPTTYDRRTAHEYRVPSS